MTEQTKACLSKQEAIQKLEAWLNKELTSVQLTIWATSSILRWEENELDLDDEDLLHSVLYDLTFADWAEAESEDTLDIVGDYSLTVPEAQAMLRRLRGEA